MGYEPRLLAPFDKGLVKYYKPWVIGDVAFPILSNAYAWRGSVGKREGYSFLTNLPGGDKPVQGLKNWIDPASLAPTSIAYSLTKSYIYNAGAFAYEDITFLAEPFGTPFSWSNGVDDFFWTSNYAGSMWSTNNLTADHIRFWNGSTDGGWNIHQPTVNGTKTLDAALIILPYKGRLVVLNTNEGGSNFQSRARWSQIGSPYTSNSSAQAITGITTGVTTVIMLADTSSFTIGLGAAITLVLGTVSQVLNFNQFPVISIVPGVSITIAVDTTGLGYTGGGFVQGPGTTVPPSPFEISIFGWRDDIAGRGGFVDADTSERIISAEIIKDTLIVGFQRSTWRLRYTGNEILPFNWERLNTQYGAESTFSNIAFDDAALFFSRYGWIACDTNNVARIDLDIPDDSFSVDVVNTNFTGLSFVQGIRDYYRQMAYWTFPTLNNSTEPNEIYAYNYIDKTWSIFNPTAAIRCFGTFVATESLSWQNLSNADDTWENFSGSQETWSQFGTSQNIGFPYILGGDDQGNIYNMFQFQQPSTSDAGTNFGFNINTKRFNPYFAKGTRCKLGYVDIYATTINGCEITLNHYIDDQNSPVFSRIVEIFPRSIIDISNVTVGATTTITTTNPNNLLTGQRVLLTDIVGTLAPILNNNTYVITVVDGSNFTITQNTVGYTYTSAGSINTGLRPNYGSATYTRVYLGAIAHMHQIELTMSAAQIADTINGDAQFQLQGIVIWTRPTGMIRG